MHFYNVVYALPGIDVATRLHAVLLLDQDTANGNLQPKERTGMHYALLIQAIHASVFRIVCSYAYWPSHLCLLCLSRNLSIYRSHFSLRYLLSLLGLSLSPFVTFTFSTSALALFILYILLLIVFALHTMWLSRAWYRWKLLFIVTNDAVRFEYSLLVIFVF